MTQKLFAIVAHDNPGGNAARKQYRDGHLDHFRQIASSIAVAGPLLDDNGDSAGSLIIVKADSAEAALELLDGDPFVSKGVWSGFDVKAFKAASGEWV